MKSSPVPVRIMTLSSKGQVTIPKALRDRLGMQPGYKVQLWVERGSMRAKALLCQETN
jgi:AbrB family looped-hinge helix DNA binding protein